MNKERAREVFEWWKESNKDVLNDELYDDEQEKKDREELAQALDIISDSLDNEWVDVNDRLPDEFKEYYVTLDNFTEELVEYTPVDAFNGEWTIGKWKKINGKASFEIYDVIAWREKPEPYERKE